MTAKLPDRSAGDPPRSRRRHGAAAHDEDAPRRPVGGPMTSLERKLVQLEAELDAAKTASQLKVAVRYYLQVKAALAREREKNATAAPRRRSRVQV